MDEVGDAGEVEGYRRLEFKLVEIVGQPPLPPSLEALEKDPLAENVDVEGKKGQTLDYVDDQEKYVVETFDGQLVAVREEFLREYVPPPVGEGGFDMAFPGSEGRAADFQADMATILAEQKYCVVQMTYPSEERKVALRQLGELEMWQRFMPEFENLYMGRRPDGKRAQWYNTDFSILDENPELESIPGLETVNQQLTNLATCICNVAPYLGFNGVCRSNALIHMNCASSEEEMNLIDDARSNAVGAGILQTHLSFLHRRKVCMFYFVSGSGGTLTLHPPNKDDEDIVISCREGQAIAFRHDLMDYTYLPEGKQLAMQAWVFREQQAGEVSMTQPDLLAHSDVIDAIPRGPIYGNAGKSVDNMSFSTRLPGMIMGPESYWTGLTGGVDGSIKIPFTRWDHDIYWHPDPEEGQMLGKCYIRHEGMLDNDLQMFCFDHNFFGFDYHQTTKIDPNARIVMEVGYDALYRAGYTKSNMRGVKMVAVHGMAGSEFSGQQIMSLHMPIESDTRTSLDLSMTAARLHYLFGMTGRTATVETACSSSLTAVALMHTHLRPDQVGQMKLGAGGEQSKHGFATGANGHFDPGFMVGLCGAKMLSIQGRCFTFDASGDGFCRAEGHSCMYFKTSEGEDLGRLAMLCGSCLNQDGRSASMTAPHGPSQQECIRHSLREANVPNLVIQMQELHGTGTSLGDPIEVGALRATMMMHNGVIRDHPLVKTSSKSNFGHTEMNAGLAGIIKCVLMAIYCDACPNNHIRTLNPHIDANAYPVYFVTESVDQGKNNGYVGVSSFGFGGSNARGDIWARALCGPRSTNPGEPAPQLNVNRIHVWSQVSKQTAPRMHTSRQLQNALDNLEDYEDAYLVGEQPSEDDNLYCIGSFNGWVTPEKMTYVEDSGSYIFPMPLGEAGVEQFQICMNKNEYFKIFPAAKMAGPDAIVLGPGMAPVGNVWVVDGRPEKIPHGTIYLITLQWDLETRKKTITWEPCLEDYIVSLAGELQPFRHRYYVVGTWTTWKPIEMMPVRGERPGTFQATVRIGIHRKEEFRFQRDRDKLQSIYPARNRETEVDLDEDDGVWEWTEEGVRAIEGQEDKFGSPQAGTPFTPEHMEAALAGDPDMTIEGLAAMNLISNGGVQSVPVCGPDHLGEDKRWVITGFMGEEVKLLLRVADGEITVNTINARVGIRTWTSQRAAAKRKYFVTGTFNEWGFSEMRPSAKAERTGVFKLKVKAEESRMIAFQICVDEDRAQTIHPEMALTDQGLSPAMGPDAKGEGLFWGLHLKKGDKVEIKLDLSREDKRKAVTWVVSKKKD